MSSSGAMATDDWIEERPGDARERSTVTSVEDAARAGFYGILSTLLSAPPTQQVLDAIIRLKSEKQTPIGGAIAALAAAARDADANDIADEFQDLFIGIGRGELLPYESYYLTGFLHEKPLARLREHMEALGISPDPDVREPEDHIAAVLEIMSGLIDGTLGPGTPEEAARFFDAHIESWVPLFLADLEAAEAARFYKFVGALGTAFLRVELDARGMA
ncbi:MAG: molecular chaperone TorD family protein [Pseudomonadota bacterium]